jgi:hypothetical protein
MLGMRATPGEEDCQFFDAEDLGTADLLARVRQSPRNKPIRACGRKSSINGASESFLSDAGAEKKIKNRKPADEQQTTT